MLNVNPESEGRRLDRLEYDLATLQEQGKLDLAELIAACTAIGVPQLGQLDITELNIEIFPTAARQRAMANRKRQIEALIALLEAHRRELGSPGREARETAQRALDEMPGANRAKDRNATRLFLSPGYMPAKTLGSGHRRIIQIVSQVLTNDIVLIDEPEIYLHPKLLMRLLDFLVSQRERCQLILSTHSGVVIDHLYDASDTRMYDLATVSDLTAATSKNLVDATREEVRAVLSQLGWRPSHLLQANAVIWVEGPSDRVLVERFIELWSRGQIRAGRDYSIAWYGGALLKHLVPDNNAPSIWDINRNNILICDSDRKSAEDSVRPSKLAMLEAITARGGYGFITYGREIENYLPRHLVDPQGRLNDDLCCADLPLHSGFEKSKATFAKAAALNLNRRDLEMAYDLAEHLDNICTLLAQWSGHDYQSS